MTSLSRAVLLAAAALFCAAPALAQSDLLTAPKVSCTIVSVTECTGPGKCTTESAGEEAKAAPLIIDFAAKTVSQKKEGKLEKLADVLEDKAGGATRNLVLGDAAKPNIDRVPATL